MATLSASVSISGCTFEGGVLAVGLTGGYSEITDCVFSGNSHGAIYGGDPLILKRCVLSGNTGASAVTTTAWGFSAIDCVFARNTTPDHGGAVYAYDAIVNLVRCQFLANSAGIEGGAVLLNPNDVDTITNCIFVGNTAPTGGAISAGSSFGYWATIADCSFAGNAAEQAKAVAFRNLYSLDIRNCVLWDGGDEIQSLDGSPGNVDFSDVFGGWPGYGNVDADPLFVRNPSPGPDGVWGTEDDDYGDLRLTATSPCVDVADPNFLPTPGETDLDGHLRVWDGNGDGVATVDMGAHEFGSSPYGDMNCDGAVDFSDINPFVLYLSNFTAWQTTYPGCPAQVGDINGDGTYPSFDDINPFVALLTGG